MLALLIILVRGLRGTKKIKKIRRIFDHCSGQSWTVVFMPNQIPFKVSMSKGDIYGKY